MPTNLWSSEEEERLRKLWQADIPLAEVLSQFPNRTRTAVIHKASYLGVERTLNCRWEDDAAVSSLSDAYCTWLAGFIDGEGCFGIYPQKNSILTRLSIANTHFPTLLSVYETLKCGHVAVKRNDGTNSMVSYTFALSSKRKVAALIGRLEPHLRIKGEQAALVSKCVEEQRSGQLTKKRIDYYVRTAAVLNRRGSKGRNKEPFAKEYSDYLSSR